VLTVAVAGFADVIAQLIAPVAVNSMVEFTLDPWVTVTSFAVPVTSAVTTSAPDATTAQTAMVVSAAVIARLQRLLLLIHLKTFI
jgi:hypothetical protein